MLQKEIYNNIFNKKANVSVMENSIILESNQEVLRYDYIIKKYIERKPVETIPMELIINQTSDNDYNMVIKIDGKVYNKKIVHDSSWAYKIMKNQIKTGDFEYYILKDIKEDRFSSFVQKLIGTLGYKDYHDDEDNIVSFTVSRK